MKIIIQNIFGDKLIVSDNCEFIPGIGSRIKLDEKEFEKAIQNKKEEYYKGTRKITIGGRGGEPISHIGSEDSRYKSLKNQYDPTRGISHLTHNYVIEQLNDIINNTIYITVSSIDKVPQLPVLVETKTVYRNKSGGRSSDDGFIDGMIIGAGIF